MIKLPHGWKLVAFNDSKQHVQIQKTVILSDSARKFTRRALFAWQPPFLKRVDTMTGMCDRLPPDTIDAVAALCQIRYPR